MSSRHVENSVEFRLKNIREKNKDGSFTDKITEFEPKKFVKKYSQYLKNSPFFAVTYEEVVEAGKVLDLWVLDTYKGDVATLGDYEVFNIPPPILEKRELIPLTLRPYWDILFKVNQNKWCNYQVLKQSIPGNEDLSVTLFAGYKATSPFSHDDKLHYSTLTVKGSLSSIDRFIAGVKC